MQEKAIQKIKLTLTHTILQQKKIFHQLKPATFMINMPMQTLSHFTIIQKKAGTSFIMMPVSGAIYMPLPGMVTIVIVPL